MKNLIWIIVILVIIGGGWWFNQQPETSPAADEPIKIGLIMPLSGELGVFGTNVKKGVEIALEQKNVSTSSIRLISEDSGAFTTNAAFTAFKKVVDVDDVDVIIGPFGPAQTLTIAPNIGTTSPVVISVSNCDERFKEYPTLFCIYPGITDQVLGAVDFMTARDWRKVYLLTENTEFGILVENLLKQQTNRVNLVGSDKVVPNQTKDFRTLITKAVAASPDVVYAMFAPNEGFVILRQFPPLAKGIPLYIGTDINKNQLLDIFGQNAPGVYFATRIDEQYEEDFTRRFKEVTGNEPDYFAALGHSTMVILLDGLERANNDIQKLPEALTNIVDPITAVRDFKFTDDRTVSVPLDSYEFKSGRFVRLGE